MSSLLSIDAMVARIDDALTEPHVPFSWMPVLREHDDAEVPGPMFYDGEALSPDDAPIRLRYRPEPSTDRPFDLVSNYYQPQADVFYEMWARDAVVRTSYLTYAGLGT